MALSQPERRHLYIACGSVPIGDEIADVIDAGGGTLSAGARERLKVVMGSTVFGDSIADKIDADTALANAELHRLGIAMGSRVHANGVDAEQG